MRTMISRGVVTFICLSACLPAAGIERVIEKSFDVSRGGTLKLETDTGSVDVSSHALNQVLVKVLLSANTSNSDQAEEIFDNFEVSIKDVGGNVNIDGEFEDWRFRRNNRLRVQYTIVVPEEYDLKLETAGGNVKVADNTGLVNVKTSGGNVEIGTITGQVLAKTSGGNITLDGASGSGTVHTSGGDIHIGRIGGDFTATTSGGDIYIDGVEGDLMASTSGGNLRLTNIHGNLVGKTSGGEIVAELTSQFNDRIDLHTSGGGIKLTVPADLNANLDANAYGGHVYTDLPVTVRGKIGESSLSGVINKGGPKVVLSTSGGRIEIRKSVN